MTTTGSIANSYRCQRCLKHLFSSRNSKNTFPYSRKLHSRRKMPSGYSSMKVHHTSELSYFPESPERYCRSLGNPQTDGSSSIHRTHNIGRNPIPGVDRKPLRRSVM